MNSTNKTKLSFFYNFMLSNVLILSIVLIQPAFSNVTTDVTEKNIPQLLQSLGIPQSNESFNDVENFNKALLAFSKSLEADDKKTLSLLQKWDEYLAEITHFSNDAHIKAMQIQQTIYLKAIATFGNSISHQKDKEKEYSPSWIDDLTNQFGKDYIKKNQYSVKSSLRAISASDEAYKKELKDLIYAEAMLFGSYKQYYELFLSFYNEKLGKNSQKKLETRKNLAEVILKMTANKPLTSMYETSDLQKILAVNEARQLNEGVYIFLKKHTLSYTFGNLIRELKDFNKAIGRQ